jgi:hypothetical protein
MRYRRNFHDHDTNERPDFGMWVDQSALPAKSTNGWTLTDSSIDGNGYLNTNGVGTDYDVYRNIPGVITGHLYKVTVTCLSIGGQTWTISLGGVTVAVFSSPGTKTFAVRPTNGDVLNFHGPSAAVFTLATIEAMEPISLERIPVI